jgi:hypothetical protein
MTPANGAKNNNAAWKWVFMAKESGRIEGHVNRLESTVFARKRRVNTRHVSDADARRALLWSAAAGAKLGLWKNLLKSWPLFCSESSACRTKGEAGVFVDGFLNLPVAGIIIGFHNVWSGMPAVLTLVGWCLLIKSLLRFCLPKYGLKMIARVSVVRAWEFQVAGAGLLALAGLVGYGVALS